MTARTESYSITGDLAPVAGVVEYYEIKEIIETDNYGYRKVVLFKVIHMV